MKVWILHATHPTKPGALLDAHDTYQGVCEAAANVVNEIRDDITHTIPTATPETWQRTLEALKNYAPDEGFFLDVFTDEVDPPLADAANALVAACHGAAIQAGGWTDLVTNESLIGKRNVPEMLCLIHSEISEALEGHRKSLSDPYLSHRPAIEVELADAIIRIADLAGALNLDLGGAIAEKMSYNSTRKDHSREARLASNGKQY